jgi:hypothetical protein
MYTGASEARYIQYHDEEWGVPCVDDQRLMECAPSALQHAIHYLAISLRFTALQDPKIGCNALPGLDAHSHSGAHLKTSMTETVS